MKANVYIGEKKFNEEVVDLTTAGNLMWHLISKGHKNVWLEAVENADA